MIRMKKVKVTKEGKIYLIWEKAIKPGLWDEYSMTCSDQALPEFYDALNDMDIHVVEMCELPASYRNRIHVKSVSYSFGGDADVMGATISANMDLMSSPAGLNLNTPHKAADSYNPEQPVQDETLLLTEECIDALDRVVQAALDYIKGERAQMNLFHEETNEKTGPDSGPKTAA